MGWLMTLQLSGTATHCVGLRDDRNRSVIRLRAVENRPNGTPSDFAIVRTSAEFDRARSADWKSIFFVGVQAGAFLSEYEIGRQVISVSSQFDYLSDGDIIGIRHASKRFRTLFRRNSKHNSFLVTERCNNYCLMCSQPPKMSTIIGYWMKPERACRSSIQQRAHSPLRVVGR